MLPCDARALGAIGRIPTGFGFPGTGFRALVVTLAIGSASFCCLGLALTDDHPVAESAPPITNMTIFPLYFVSGVFIPESEIPMGSPRRRHLPGPPLLRRVASRASTPATVGAGFEWGDLAVVAAWGVAGF